MEGEGEGLRVGWKILEGRGSVVGNFCLLKTKTNRELQEINSGEEDEGYEQIHASFAKISKIGLGY